MGTGLSTSILGVTQDISDFYHEVRDYWSTRNLMQGYGEAAHEATRLVEDATRNSHPVAQACAGSGMAVAKMLGAIPIGIDHWVLETARSTIHQGAGAGFKTLIATPIEGFIDGGKFVLHQGKNWTRGEIAETRVGVADEVATTLGTAGLMFLGIKSIHSGGTGLIQGLKNFELPTPAPALATGQVLPAASSSAATVGAGPLAEGLVFMSSKKDPKDDEPSTPEKSPSSGAGRDPLENISSKELKRALFESELLELQGIREPQLITRKLWENLALRAVGDYDAFLQLKKMGMETVNLQMLLGVIDAARKDPNVFGVLHALKRSKVKGAEEVLKVLSEENLLPKLPRKSEPH